MHRSELDHPPPVTRPNVGVLGAEVLEDVLFQALEAIVHVVRAEGFSSVTVVGLGPVPVGLVVVEVVLLTDLVSEDGDVTESKQGLDLGRVGVVGLEAYAGVVVVPVGVAVDATDGTVGVLDSDEAAGCHGLSIPCSSKTLHSIFEEKTIEDVGPNAIQEPELDRDHHRNHEDTELKTIG